METENKVRLFEDVKVMVNVGMMISLKKDLEEQAKKESRSLTGLIVFALKKYLEEQNKGA
ncbi:MAG: hypothetical protein WC856_02120 [Methylococcaceae bacterium]|jgi:hypothetical protein